jgi:hypothetical protein
VALFPAKFPAGWAEQVSAGIHGQADFWMDRQAKNPYRKVWYTPSDGYFPLMGWGKNGFNHLRWLVAAFRLTGSETYRDGALLGVDWMHGANPQGRVYTSGLGRVSMVNFLHLPSFIDGVDEPVPGITPYALTGTNAYAGAKEVYGLFADPHPTMAFPGSALAQLPPPWNNAGLDLEDVRGALDTTVPLWRRFTALEQQNVPQAEFAIAETVSPAVAVTGCLLGPGWKPSPALMARKPRSRADLQDAWLYQP